jgi:hypothetical protein
MKYDEYDPDDPIHANLIEKLKKLDADIEAGSVPRRERTYLATKYENEALVQRNSEEQRAAREGREGKNPGGDKGPEISPDNPKSAKQNHDAGRDPEEKQSVEETIRRMKEAQRSAVENERDRRHERDR